MLARAYTVAFEGLDAKLVEVQCALAPGTPGFQLVGMADKSVAEAKDRIRSALQYLSIALPNKRITINLSPADLPKEGSHFDLPIALALLAALDILPRPEVENTLSLGELSLDGRLISVIGSLPAALTAASQSLTLVCPTPCSSQAAWVGATPVFGANSLHDAMRHISGQHPLPMAKPKAHAQPTPQSDLRDIRGQERAKRALEIAAAGRHNLLLLGPPGAGKTMLASRLCTIMPPLSPKQALETALIHSMAGLSQGQDLSLTPPFRHPHHSASRAAMVGGGRSARPGEISLAHNGVLFMDEFPEFSRDILESLRQPLEANEIIVARANANLHYPAKFLLIAAANPCRCGYLTDANRACGRAPLCGSDYMAKISGPLLDRFDLRLELPPVSYQDLDQPLDGESSTSIAAKVQTARDIQSQRLGENCGAQTNADLSGALLERHTQTDQAGRALLTRIAEHFSLSARGYHRLLRVSRTIADLEGCETLKTNHIGEAASYRLTTTKTY